MRLLLQCRASILRPKKLKERLNAPAASELKDFEGHSVTEFLARRSSLQTDIETVCKRRMDEIRSVELPCLCDSG